MGLSVEYYSQIEPVKSALPNGCVCGECDLDDEACCICDEYVQAKFIDGFSSQYEGLERDAVYKSNGEQGEFYGLSCSGYTDFRDALAKMVGYPMATLNVYREGPTEKHLWGAFEAKSGPFLEQLNFPDCDTCIGPAASKRLYDDYVKFERMAKSFHIEENYLFADVMKDADGTMFYRVYKQFMKAFEVALDDGLVSF